jgi:hypothetical protein
MQEDGRQETLTASPSEAAAGRSDAEDGESPNAPGGQVWAFRAPGFSRDQGKRAFLRTEFGRRRELPFGASSQSSG